MAKASLLRTLMVLGGPRHCARPVRCAGGHRAAEQGRRHRTDLFRPAGDRQGLGNHHRNRRGRRNRRLVGKRLDWRPWRQRSHLRPGGDDFMSGGLGDDRIDAGPRIDRAGGDFGTVDKMAASTPTPQRTARSRSASPEQRAQGLRDGARTLSTCPELCSDASFREGYELRLMVFEDMRGKTLNIGIISPASDFDEFLLKAQKVVDSV
jgi:hypothetical protein